MRDFIGKNDIFHFAILSITYSVRSLFWGFYGYLAPNDYDIAVGNSGPNYEVLNYDVTRYTLEVESLLFYFIENCIIIESLEWKIMKFYVSML